MYHFFRRCTRVLALILFLGAGLVFTSTPAQAQMSIKPGVRVGLNYASLGGDAEEIAFDLTPGSISPGPNVEADVGSRTGFVIGGYAIFDFGAPVALQPGLRFIQRGYSTDISASGGGISVTVTNDIKLSYIDIPVLARYTLPVGGTISPHIIAGPTVGFNVSAKSEVSGLGSLGSVSGGSSDISDDISTADFGLEFGAGADYSLGSGTVTFDARYGLGLSNILSDADDLSLSNRALMVTAGFIF